MAKKKAQAKATDEGSPKPAPMAAPKPGKKSKLTIGTKF